MNTNTPLRRIAHELYPGFSAAVVVPLGPKSMVYLSGEVGRDQSGAVVPGGFEGEARQCFMNIKQVLERSGATFADVVRITAYLKDLGDYSVYAKVRSEVFGGNPPASATVGVADLLAGAKLEVDAVAVVATA
jgi:2-iminobutanoate/2-iminopropanoate deaminase